MSPSLVLARWCKRAGGPLRSTINPRYFYGALNEWGNWLIESRAWMLPGLVVTTILVGIFGFSLIVIVPFTVKEQIAFSLVLLAVAFYVRRYAGTLFTMILIALSLTVSTRYLVWRITDTLGQTEHLNFLLAVGLLLAEVYA